MKIVKKSNGNIVILNTDGTVKQVIQQTGVQLLDEGNQIKLIQSGYPIGYIDAADVTHTQLEPAAQVAFSGDNSALMTLLAEDFFVLSTATDAAGFVETEVNVSSAQILAMGVTPIELLPASGAGTYYVFDSIVLEYTHNTTAYTTATPALYFDGAFYGNVKPDLITSGLNLISISRTPTTDTFVDTNTYVLLPSVAQNTALTITTWDGLNPTLGDGTIKAKIKYKIETFG